MISIGNCCGWLVGWLVGMEEDDIVANVNDGVIVNNANDDTMEKGRRTLYESHDFHADLVHDLDADVPGLIYYIMEWI